MRATARQRRRAVGHAWISELTDYRDVDGQFDRIVSVGMFEHVGVAALPEYFDTVDDC